MQGWMIALIVVSCVLAALVILFFAGAFLAVKKVLGRRKKAWKGEYPEKYGVDLSWMDAVKDVTTTLELVSYDGIKLRALYIKHPEGGVNKVAVCQHGYCATPGSVQPQAKIFYEKGFDVLLPAARAHNISDGKYCGMAWLDRFDMLRWLDRVVEMYGQSVKIALFGVSMGGSTMAAVSGMNPPPQVKCVIDDCGFSSQKEEYYACLAKVPLPKALCLVPLAVGVRFACGYSLYAADITPLVRASVLPSLFIHGDKDTFVPCEQGKKLYEACGASDKQLYIAEGAVHASAYVVDKEKYTSVLTEFVDKYIHD